MFGVGALIAYPMHGAGIVEAIEENEILGQSKNYYVLRFSVGGMKVMVPVSSAVQGGLRPIVTKDECKKVLAFLSCDADGEECANWNKRYHENFERLRTGDIYDVAGVVRSLTLRDRKKGLSGGERKMLNNARKILVSELMLVLEQEEQALLEMIDEAI